MIRIGTRAGAQQAYRRLVLRHEKGGGAFANIDSVAVAAEGVAQPSRHGFERGKSRDRHAAQRVGAADHDGIADTGFDQPPAGGEHLGAGRTGRRDGVSRSRHAQHQRRMIGERADLPLTIVTAGRPLAVARALGAGAGVFGDAGGAGAQDHADARRSMAADCLVDGITVLQDGGQHQPVVAAIVGSSRRRRGRQRDSNLAHPDGSPGAEIVAGNQPGIGAIEQGAGDFGRTRAQRRDESHGGQAQRSARCHDCSTD